MNIDNIFANNNNLAPNERNSVLVPFTESEYSLLDWETTDSRFISPLNRDLVFTDEYMVFDDNGDLVSNSLYFGESEGNSQELAPPRSPSNSELDAVSLNSIPPLGDLELVGGFGDYDGGNDTTLEVKDGQTVIETFSMTGEGFATLYRDDEGEYIFFSDTDETTKVDIDAVSNLEFEDFSGDALSVVTRGSIEAGDITLVEDEDPDTDSGLTLRAGVGGSNLDNAVFESYSVVDFFDREMVDINYTGQIVGNDSYSGVEQFFFYDGQYVYTLPGYESSRAFGINDYVQMVGEGVSSTNDDPHVPFLAFSNGAVQEVTYSEGAENARYTAPPGEDALEFSALGHMRDINNFLETAYYQLNTPPEEAPPEYELTPFEDANFLSSNGSESVNIGYELLNSDDSRAFGINNSGDVVGINRETDRAFVFNRENNSVTNLGTLAGSNYSAAYAINDEGQVVGTSENQAFLYEDGEMKDMGVSYTGNPTKRLGIDINNLGQAVVTSTEGVPLIYEDGELTDINTLLNSEYNADAGYVITQARGINDRGQIIAQGTLNGDARGFLLNPSFTPNDTVTVGNISTFGESVILEGDKVYLDGQNVKTEGGRVIASGDTTINDNLAIDTSKTDVEEGEVIGGNITFLNALDSNEEGEQSLTIKAASGNLTFTEAVGENSPIFDLTVEGAGSLTANADLAIDNELKLEVIDGVTTANITSGGLASIKTGQIGEEIFDSTGNVTTGNIDALSLEVGSNGSFTGENITTSDGNIEILSLNDISVDKLDASNGGVNLISSTAEIEIDGTINAERSIFASAQLDVTSNGITSTQNAVILNSSQGAVSVNGSVLADGEVSLASANDVTVNAVTSSENTVSLVSATGTVKFAGAIIAGEDVNVASLQDLTINTSVKAKFGSTSIASLEGSLRSTVPIYSGFNTDIFAKEDIRILGIRNGGSIGLTAESGQINILGNTISGGGEINVLAKKYVDIGNVISKSGSVNIISIENSIKTGYIRTDYFSREGDVYLYAKNNVRITGTIDIDGIKYSIYTGDAGAISIAKKLGVISTNDANFSINNIQASAIIGSESVPVTVISSAAGIGAGAAGAAGTAGGAGAGIGITVGSTVIWIGVFGIIINAGETAPRHQSEINPITAQPYADAEEFELVGQLTDKQRERLEEIYKTKSLKVAPYVPRTSDKKKIKYAINNNCFSLEMRGHLGSLPMPGDSPQRIQIKEAAAKYATDLSNSKNDYLVIDVFGNFAYYDALAITGSPADLKIADTTGTGRKVIEAKYGYPTLNKFIRPEAQLPTGFSRDARLTYNDGKKTKDERNQYNQMRDELLREGIVARNCLLNYAAIYNNQIAALAAKELFTFPQTKIIIPGVETKHIPLRDLR